jgi:hypothetical protein
LSYGQAKNDQTKTFEHALIESQENEQPFPVELVSLAERLAV